MTNLARVRFVIFLLGRSIVCLLLFLPLIGNTQLILRPTKEHYPEIYLDSPLNEAFAQDLTDFIVSNPIDYWIYRHHHFNQPDFKVGNTQLLTNQLGYIMREEHEGFDWGKCIEV